MTGPPVCICCAQPAMSVAMDFGPQPVSSHYHIPGAPVATAPMAIGQCASCGIVQLERPFSHELTTPPHEWIYYKEPEGHLDAVADSLAAALPQDRPLKLLGLSYKDQSTLDRLAAKGFADSMVLDIRDDLGATSSYPNIESVAGLLTPDRALAIVAEHGKFDVIIARHVLEHCEDPRRFMAALDLLLAEDGLVMFEVPDCEGNLRRNDIAMIWEEHATYFTLASFKHFFTLFDCHAAFAESYPLRFEHCLVTFVKRGRLADHYDLAGERSLFTSYCQNLKPHEHEIASWFKQRTEAGERFAIYGAGHLAATFVNLYGLQAYITCIVDDTPQKQGLVLPGTAHAIAPSEMLLTERITTCLLALAVEAEDKVIAKNQTFIDAGGVFRSIFAASERSFQAAQVREAA